MAYGAKSSSVKTSEFSGLIPVLLKPYKIFLGVNASFKRLFCKLSNAINEKYSCLVLPHLVV